METSAHPLADRLHALERAMPGGELPRGTFTTSPKSPRRRWRASLVLGIVVTILVSGTAGAGIQQAVTGHPGVFDPGGALACSNIRAMQPPNANAALAAIGYQVTWQIEDRDRNTSTISLVPPADGFIVGGVLQQGNQMLLVVVRGVAENPGGGCR